MASDTALPQARLPHKAPSATPDRAPSERLARAGVAAAIGGFDPGRIGGEAASWVQGRSALPDMLLANIIVGLYYVSSTRGL
jgi:hypothetical protein